MARSIGSVEVTVDANTGRMRATLVADARKSGSEAAKVIQEQLDNISASVSEVDVDRAAAEKAAQLLRKQIEAAIKGIPVDINFTEARRQLREFDAEMEARDLAIHAELSQQDIGKINANLRRMKEQAEADEIQLKIDMRRSLAEAELQMEKFHRSQQFKAVGIDIDVAGSLEQAEAEIFAVKQRTQLDTWRVNIQTEIDTLDTLTDLQTLNAMIENYDFDANVKVRVDKASKAKADALLKTNMEDTGTAAGLGFGKNLLSGDNTKAIIAAAATMGDALASGLSGGVSAATSVVSSGINAIGGAAGAAAPLIAGLVTSMAALVVGSIGVVDAMGAVNKEFAAAKAEGREMNLSTGEVGAALKQLAPAARSTVEAFAGMRDELDGVQKVVQQALFSGMGDELRSLGEDVIPEVGDSLAVAARSVNEFGKQLADVARNTDFIGMAKELDPALDSAFDAATDLVGTLEPFLKAAAPAAERLASMLESGAKALREWVTNNPTEIQDFLDGGLDSLHDWLELLGNVGDLLGTVFKAGKDQGDSFVDSLAHVIEKFDQFLESAKGQDALQDFFDSGKEAMEALKPVLEGLKEAFNILVTDSTMANFRALAEAIGGAIPSLAQLITLIGQLQMGTAFANLLSVLEPVFNLLNSFPPEMLAMVGAAIVAATAVMKLVEAVKAIGIAFKALTATDPILLGIAAALTVAIAAMALFGNSQSDAQARTKELTAALREQTDALIATGDAANASSAGFDQLNKTIFETGDAGKEIQEAFAAINRGAGDASLGVDDTVTTLSHLKAGGKEAEDQLANLAVGFGLPEEAARTLAKAVNATDSTLFAVAHSGDRTTLMMEQLAKETGLSVDQISKLAGQLEELQDQGENVDLQKLAQGYIDVASTGSKAEQQILATATANETAAGKADDAVAIYEEYVRLSLEAAAASKEAADGGNEQASSYGLVQQAIEDAIAERKAMDEELKKERKAAMDAHEAELLLADATTKAAEAAAVSMGMSEGMAESLIAVGEAADAAADKADALSSTLDVLFGTGIDASAAFDDFYASINDLNAALAETGDDKLPRVGSALEATFATTPAALAFRDAMREGVEQMFDFATAATEAGTPSDEINAKLAAMRDTLITTGSQFGLSKQEVDAFITSLMGTPELISTVIETPGLMDALINAKDLTLLYDDAGNPVITEFEAMGIDTALADSEAFKSLVETLAGMTASPKISAETAPPSQEQVEAVTTAADTLNDTTGEPTIQVPTADPVKEQITGIQDQLTTLNTTVATPVVELPSAPDVQSSVDTLESSLIDVGNQTATPVVSIPSAATVKTSIDDINNKLNNLDGRTVTVHIKQDGTTNFAKGGIVGPMGGIGGEAGLELATYRGVTNILTGPTALAPGTVVTPMPGASPIGNQGQIIQKQVNSFITVNPSHSDEEQIAVATVNRIAAVAASL